MSENLVRKLHDFQWDQVHKATKDYSTIYVSRFFKLVLRENKVNKFIGKIYEEQIKLAEEFEALEDPQTRWSLSWDIGQKEKQISRLRQQINKCKKTKRT